MTGTNKLMRKETIYQIPCEPDSRVGNEGLVTTQKLPGIMKKLGSKQKEAISVGIKNVETKE